MVEHFPPTKPIKHVYLYTRLLDEHRYMVRDRIIWYTENHKLEPLNSFLPHEGTEKEYKGKARERPREELLGKQKKDSLILRNVEYFIVNIFKHFKSLLRYKTGKIFTIPICQPQWVNMVKCVGGFGKNNPPNPWESFYEAFQLESKGGNPISYFKTFLTNK